VVYHMQTVLHVGPANSPGGMASVIRILANNPPEGWSAEILNSHSTKGIIAKLLAWKNAKKAVKNSNADLIHIHCAADWSFRRKLSIAKKANAPVVFHIHSGKFNIDCKKELNDFHVVCLSDGWSERLSNLIGDSTAILNPVEPSISPGVKRDDFVLLMGRADPVKGHDFAFSLGLAKLKVTGLNIAPEGVEALGWVSEEEKLKLLQTAKVLLVPSGYEGQPMVILEALAANCPIIASTNVPDLPDCIISIDLNDRDGWVKAIDQPITSGLLEAVEPHRIENVQKKWQRLYDEIIASNASTE